MMVTDINPIDKWRDFIAGGRSKVTRPVANNTTVRLTNDGVVFKLHNTDIVTITPNGYILNSGGWQTSTTKERIDRFTPARLYQNRSAWYINDRDGNKSLFYDGIVLDWDGYPVESRNPVDHEVKLKALKKDAKAYARGYVEQIKAGKISLPSQGDCWGCYFGLGSDKPNPMGVDHLREHMSEKYYVPSLLVNAGRDARYRDEQIGLMGIGGQRIFIDPERIIYKYIVKHLGKEL